AAYLQTIVAQKIHALFQNGLDILVPGAALLALGAAPVLAGADQRQVLVSANDDPATGLRLPLDNLQLANRLHGIVLRNRKTVAHRTPITVLKDRLAHVAEQDAHTFERAVIVGKDGFELLHPRAQNFAEVT